MIGVLGYVFYGLYTLGSDAISRNQTITKGSGVVVRWTYDARTVGPIPEEREQWFTCAIIYVDVARFDFNCTSRDGEALHFQWREPKMNPTGIWWDDSSSSSDPGGEWTLERRRPDYFLGFIWNKDGSQRAMLEMELDPRVKVIGKTQL